jgi:hypothetical protein
MCASMSDRFGIGRRSGDRFGLWDRLARLAKLRLLVPLQRSRHRPEYSARGTAIGLAMACTPAVGIHMLLVFVLWLMARRLFRWDFSLILGLAWTWACNVFTLLPSYYLFYATGRVLLGHWDDISGYGRFRMLWHGIFNPDQTIADRLAALFEVLVRDWGLAMWVGCLPWSMLVALLGYWWSLRFIQAYRRARHERMTRVARQRRHAV